MPEKELRDFIVAELNGKPFIFYTLSGAHLYGFPSCDSDYDIRGCHVLDKRVICGFHTPRDTIERMSGEIDFVSFDVKKELGLILQNNSNVLEHVFAPALVSSSRYPALKKIAGLSLSRAVFHPYHGLALHNWKSRNESKIPAGNGESAKRYLYILRSLMAGIFALDTGKIEPDIQVLNRHFRYPLVDEFVSIKMNGCEYGVVASHESADVLIAQLFLDLEAARENSPLPEKPPEEVFGRANDFLLDCRGVR
ncbi:MAG: nucleotidyltransferase domain-containing protein [Methanoregula sp.]